MRPWVRPLYDRARKSTLRRKCARCGSKKKAVAGATAKFLVVSFTTDWRFSVSRSKEIIDALIAARKNVASAVIESVHGHDSFLLPLPRYHDVLHAYLTRIATEDCA